MKDLQSTFYKGVSISSGLANMILPHEIPTPAVSDFTNIFHRGCVTFK